MGDEEDTPTMQDRKIFVGGLSLETDKESLGKFFSQYGDIEDCVVMRDGETEKSRGFGFLVFSTIKEMTDCLKDKPFHLDGKEIEAKKAVPKENSRRGGSFGSKTRKVFLGGLDPATTKEDIKETFMDIGTLTDIQIMTEKGTEKPRGFGFISFEDYDTVENVCAIKHFKIRDKEVEVKKAISKEDIQRSDGRRSNGNGRDGDMYSSRDHYKGAYPPQEYRMSGAYDYPRYPAGGDGYYMGGGYTDRMLPSYPPSAYGGRPYPGYDMGHMAYGGHMYPTQGAHSNSSSTVGSYSSQSSSAYGPTKGGAYSGDKERFSGRGYHPYTRR